MFKIGDLEAACTSVLAPPQFTTPQKRRDAEEFLIDFREKATISECRDILQHCQNEQVQFQTSCALKGAFPRDCVDVTKDELSGLMIGLIGIIQSDNCSNQVREQLVAIVAICAKRITGQFKVADGIELVQQRIQDLASGSEKHHQILAASLINALVQEFSGAGKSSVIGLSLEGHASAKVFYEQNALPGVFSLVLNFFKYLNSNPQIVQDSTDKLLVSKFLQIAQVILSWRFSHGKASRLALMKTDSTVEVPFQPPKSWGELVTSRDFLNVWFSTHGIVRRDAELANLSSNCIQQICSLKGSVFSSIELEAKWTIDIIQLLQGSFPNWIPAQQYESAGLSFALKYLIENRSLHVWQKCENFINPLLNCLAQWTCSMIEHSRKSEEYQTGLDYATDSWLHFIIDLIGNENHQLATVIAPFASMVWERWMRSKLSPPDGDRIDPDDEDEDIDELEESDNVRFDCQLAAIGLLSRISLPQCLPNLNKLTQSKLSVIAKCLQAQENVACAIWEDLHWLYLAIGHSLADEIDPGETRFIPQIIMNASVEQKAAAVASISESQDYVVQLLAVVFQAMEMEKAAMMAEICHAWSPQTAQDLRWLLLRISEAYIWFAEDNHGTVSTAIQSACGRDTPSGSELLQNVVNFCLLSLNAWHGEEEVLNQTCDILVALMRRTGPKAKIVGQSGELWQMARQFCQDKNSVYSRFPQSTQRKLMSVVICAGASGGMVTTKAMGEAISPLKDRFGCLTAVQLSNQIARNELSAILERLTGCAQAVQPDIATGIAEFLLPFLESMAPLVEAVRGSSDISLLLFQLMASCAKHLLPYLNDKQCQPFLKVALDLLKGHAKWNQGRSGRNCDEEIADELIQIIDLISSVLDREVLDFSTTDQDPNANGDGLAKASDMVFAGLQVILPLMGPQLLEFPDLANGYFSLLGSLCEIFPEKMFLIPDSLMLPLLHSLQLGLTHYGTESAKTSLEAISAISSYYFDNKKRGGTASETLTIQLVGLLPLVFDSMLLFANDMDVFPICREAFYFMICSFPDQFAPRVRDKSQNCNPQQQQRIEQAFTPVFNFIYNPTKSKNESMKLLEAAVYEIQGLLCMK